MLVAYAYKPGQSGNPSGRPKKKPITDEYDEALRVGLPDEIRLQLGLPRGATMASAIARRMVIRAVDSRDAVNAAREIADRVEGKAAQSVTMKLEVTDKLADRLKQARKRAGMKK